MFLFAHNRRSAGVPLRRVSGGGYRGCFSIWWRGARCSCLWPRLDVQVKTAPGRLIAFFCLICAIFHGLQPPWGNTSQRRSLQQTKQTFLFPIMLHRLQLALQSGKDKLIPPPLTPTKIKFVQKLNSFSLSLSSSVPSLLLSRPRSSLRLSLAFPSCRSLSSYYRYFRTYTKLLMNKP